MSDQKLGAPPAANFLRVPFIDLTREYESQRDAIDAAVLGVVREQRFVLGPRVEELEKKIAALAGAKFGIGCASGTDALVLALQALGIGPGDEVLTSPFTFFATGAAIARCGATVALVDINLDTFCLDIEAATKATREHASVKCVLPVELYGRIPDFDQLLSACERREIALVEDAAQSIGAHDPKGRAAGGIGRIGCFSFYPTKNLGGYQDGGMCTTSDEKLRDRLLSLRFHGSVPPASYNHDSLGLCSRLGGINAAALLVKLEKLSARNDARRANAAYYNEHLAGTPLKLPAIPAGHIVHQYTILVGDGKRDGLRDHLKREGVDSSTFYPKALHQQPALAGKVVLRGGSLARAEQATREALSLPVYPYLREDERAHVVASVRRFFEQRT